MKQGLDQPRDVTIWCGPAGSKLIHSDLLVPGDVLEIPSNATSSSLSAASAGKSSSGKGSEGKGSSGKAVGWKVPADAVLVSGACIVNESSLSGMLSATGQSTDYSRV